MIARLFDISRGAIESPMTAANRGSSHSCGAYRAHQLSEKESALIIIRLINTMRWAEHGSRQPDFHRTIPIIAMASVTAALKRGPNPPSRTSGNAKALNSSIENVEGSFSFNEEVGSASDFENIETANLRTRSIYPNSSGDSR